MARRPMLPALSDAVTRLRWDDARGRDVDAGPAVIELLDVKSLIRAAARWRPHDGGPGVDCTRGCRGCGLDRALARLTGKGARR